MKNGFTLIELLAVIVILAIIALIATPIILGIINDAREKANERSVELYASAVRNAVAAYQLTGSNPPTSFSDLTIQYDGDVECTVQELYEDGSFYLEGCKVNNGDKEYSYGVKVPVVIPDTICFKETESAIIGQLPLGNYVFEDEYTCNVNSELSYNFVVASSTEDYVYLMLTESLGKSEWIIEDDFINAGGSLKDWNATVDDYPHSKGKYAMGPVTAIKYLNEVTKKWDYIENMNDAYTDYFNHYTINITGKARLYGMNDGMYSTFNNYGKLMGMLMMDTIGAEYLQDGSFEFGSVSNYGDTVVVGNEWYYMYNDKLDIFPVIKVPKTRIEQ